MRNTWQCSPATQQYCSRLKSISKSGISHPYRVRLGWGRGCTCMERCIAKARVAGYHIEEMNGPRRPKIGRSVMIPAK